MIDLFIGYRPEGDLILQRLQRLLGSVPILVHREGLYGEERHDSAVAPL
jgi:hypothetical protein